jgi:hypothetical protein
MPQCRTRLAGNFQKRNVRLSCPRLIATKVKGVDCCKQKRKEKKEGCKVATAGFPQEILQECRVPANIEYRNYVSAKHRNDINGLSLCLAFVSRKCCANSLKLCWGFLFVGTKMNSLAGFLQFGGDQEKRTKELKKECIT